MNEAKSWVYRGIWARSFTFVIEWLCQRILEDLILFFLFMFTRGCLCECISNNRLFLQKSEDDIRSSRAEATTSGWVLGKSHKHFKLLSYLSNPAKEYWWDSLISTCKWSPVTVPQVIPTYWSGLLGENKNSKGNYLRPRNRGRVNGLGKEAPELLWVSDWCIAVVHSYGDTAWCSHVCTYVPNKQECTDHPSVHLYFVVPGTELQTRWASTVPQEAIFQVLFLPHIWRQVLTKLHSGHEPTLVINLQSSSLDLPSGWSYRHWTLCLDYYSFEVRTFKIFLFWHLKISKQQLYCTV